MISSPTTYELISIMQAWQQCLIDHPPTAFLQADFQLQVNRPLLMALPDLGILKIDGPDAKKLLQGQLTCNLDNIRPGTAVLGAHCNPQGRIISLARICLIEATYFLIMPKSMLTIAANALKKYAIFYKTDISDASNEWIVFGLIGETDGFKICSSLPRTLLLQQEKAAIDTWQQLAKQAAIASPSIWKYAELIEGIAQIYPATSGKLLPHEINLDQLNAISFDKGCYTGQEIIARMHYLGKLKKRMQCMILNQSAPLQPAEEHAAGFVVDSCTKDYNQQIALLISENVKQTS